MSEKINQKPVNQLPETLKRRVVIFIEQIRSRIKKDSIFKQEILKYKNEIKVGYKHSDVEIILNGVNNLLLQFKFVSSIKLLEGRAIKQKNNSIISRFVGENLDIIQLRPFKSGVALILKKEIQFNKQTQKKEEIININLSIACDENGVGEVLPNVAWSGTIDGLHENTQETGLNKNAFDHVTGGISKQLNKN